MLTNSVTCLEEPLSANLWVFEAEDLDFFSVDILCYSLDRSIEMLKGRRIAQIISGICLHEMRCFVVCGSLCTRDVKMEIRRPHSNEANYVKSFSAKNKQYSQINAAMLAAFQAH